MRRKQTFLLCINRTSLYCAYTGAHQNLAVCAAGVGDLLAVVSAAA